MLGFVVPFLLGAIVALVAMQRRLGRLEQRLSALEANRGEPAPAPVRQTTDVRVLPAPPPAPESEPVEPSRPRFSLEAAIAGRLPIWTGAAALVFAGFFFVRYSVESGLLGPLARTLLAGLFGLALLGLGEAARRAPRVAEDPRVAQALSGAGVASFYATLYMAASLYHLIGAGTAFAAVVAVTALALVLALRHGPPTAAMALAGGFAAPLLAGFDAAGVGPLLAYLALLIAALFALAVHRHWGWLALATTAAGFGWINFLVFAHGADAGGLSFLGAFTIAVAAGASAALPATGLAPPALRLAPLLAGFVQLLALAQFLDFGPLAWAYYLLLAAATLVLAWREAVYLPGALTAAALLLALELVALLQPERNVTPVAALAAAALFALPGHLLARRGGAWSALALLGTGGPLLVAHAAAPSLLAPAVWGLVEILAAVAAASLAWRLQSREGGAPLTAATALAALLAAIGLAQFVPDAWLSLPLALVMAALALWARRVGAEALHELPIYPFAASLVAAAAPLAGFASAIATSLIDERLPWRHLPALGLTLQMLLAPVAVALLLFVDPCQYGRLRRPAAVMSGAAALLVLYLLAKQPLAIDTLPRFIAIGFVERALISQALLAAGWGLLRYGRLRTLAKALLAIGLARILWFDLLLLNPAWEAQSVGGLPLLNAAFLHTALAAAWLWTLPPSRPARATAALLTLAAAVALVRQATHGTILTGPVGAAENGGYSAVLLVVALFWLWRGITATRHDLRVAGLALLTLVTFKVFLVDAAALDGILRILSFLGLGATLIGIGWAYGRFLGKGTQSAPGPVT